MSDEAAAEYWLRTAEAEAGFAPSEGFYCTALRVRARQRML